MYIYICLLFHIYMLKCTYDIHIRCVNAMNYIFILFSCGFFFHCGICLHFYLFLYLFFSIYFLYFAYLIYFLHFIARVVYNLQHIYIYIYVELNYKHNYSFIFLKFDAKFIFTLWGFILVLFLICKKCKTFFYLIYIYI